MDCDELGDDGGVVGGVELRASGGRRQAVLAASDGRDWARRAGGAADAAWAGAGRARGGRAGRGRPRPAAAGGAAGQERKRRRGSERDRERWREERKRAKRGVRQSLI
jgi:hypothetical protein